MAKRASILALALLLAGGAAWWWSHRPPAAPAADGAERERRAALAALPVADAAAYAELHEAKRTALDDVRIVEGLVGNYLQSVKGDRAPPLGFNEEIVRALNGANPLGVAFLPANHPAIDAQGRLRDRWGTPYFFHPLSASHIEVRSAGADRKLFTADDAVSTGDPR